MLVVTGIVLIACPMLGYLFCMFWYYRWQGGFFFGTPFFACILPLCALRIPETSDGFDLAFYVKMAPLFIWGIVIVVGICGLCAAWSPMVVLKTVSIQSNVATYATGYLTGAEARRYWLTVMLLPASQSAGMACIYGGDALQRANERTALFNALEQPDLNIRLQAAVELCLGDRGLDAEKEAKIMAVFAENYAKMETRQKKSAVIVVRHLKTSRALVTRFLLTASKDDDSSIRLETLRTLSSLPPDQGKDALPEIVRIAREDPSENVRAAAQDAVRNIDYSVFRKELEKKGR